MSEDDKEILAQWMIRHGYATGHGDTMEDLLEELEWQIAERSQRAVEIEREACAKVCEEFATDAVKEQDFHSVVTAEDCAACIRARGQHD